MFLIDVMAIVIDTMLNLDLWQVIHWLVMACIIAVHIYYLSIHNLVIAIFLGLFMSAMMMTEFALS